MNVVENAQFGYGGTKNIEKYFIPISHNNSTKKKLSIIIDIIDSEAIFIENFDFDPSLYSTILALDC